MVNDKRLEAMLHFFAVAAGAIGSVALVTENNAGVALAGLALLVIGYTSRS